VKAEVKEEWVSALRSGDYKKGTGFLRIKGPKQDKYCCLGILCDLAVKAGVIDPPRLEDRNPDDVDDYYVYGEDFIFVPKVVVEWAGLGDRNPTYVTTNGNKHFLTSDNDDNGFSFSKIADRIERYL
jgi:hypothetical protein